MSTQLEHLAALEQQLHLEVVGTTGLMETIELQLRTKGVYDAYKNVHQQYLALFDRTTEPSTKLEALKRLLFLNWYSWAEPSCFTGLGELDEHTIRTSYGILNTYLLHQQLDPELHWMLCYYSTWDYALLHYAEPNLPELTTFVKAVDQSLPYHQQRRPANLHNRGLMGRYWHSIYD